MSPIGGELNVAKSLEAQGGDRVFLLAAATAVLAALFMVAVWAPLQVRAFTTAVNEARQ
jgi:hypothetical protein